MTVVLSGRFADRDAWNPQRCPLTKALEVMGTRSAILLLREAYFGTTRFDDFTRRVGITDTVASTRLRGLVEAGLLRKAPYREPGQRRRYEYHLTQMGYDLMPALVSLIQWGDAYLQDERGPALSLSHLDCGEPVEAEVRCAAGHLVDPGQIVLRPAEDRPAPGAGAAGA